MPFLEGGRWGWGSPAEREGMAPGHTTQRHSSAGYCCRSPHLGLNVGVLVLGAVHLGNHNRVDLGKALGQLLVGGGQGLRSGTGGQGGGREGSVSGVTWRAAWERKWAGSLLWVGTRACKGGREVPKSPGQWSMQGDAAHG